MAKVEYEGVIYDSQEELDFKHWLDEAYEAGLIIGFKKLEKGEDTKELIGRQIYWTPTDKGYTDKFLFHPLTYTADFLITSKNNFIPFCEKNFGEEYHYIDVKGKFSKHNDKKQFQIIRKLMYCIKKIYVHIVKPDELFLKTWVPELCRYTEVKKDVKKKFRNTPTIQEYLKER